MKKIAITIVNDPFGRMSQRSKIIIPKKSGIMIDEIGVMQNYGDIVTIDLRFRITKDKLKYKIINETTISDKMRALFAELDADSQKKVMNFAEIVRSGIC